MAKDFSTMEDSNTSANPGIHNISQPKRRVFLGASAAVLLGTLLPACAQTPSSATSAALQGA